MVTAVTNVGNVADSGQGRRASGRHTGPTRSEPTPPVSTQMKLQQFMPYRLAVVAEAVSRAIADVYRERFGLTRDEWRVLAALAEAGEMKSRDAAL